MLALLLVVAGVACSSGGDEDALVRSTLRQAADQIASDPSATDLPDGVSVSGERSDDGFQARLFADGPSGGCYEVTVSFPDEWLLEGEGFVTTSDVEPVGC